MGRFLFLFILTTLTGLASGSEPEWISYQTQNAIEQMVEENGKIWLASDGGAVLYDLAGGDRVIYNKTNSGLVYDKISCIYIDHNGNKWFGTFDGLSKFDGADWETFNKDNSGLPHNWVRSITEDSQGNMWFGTLYGLAKFDGSAWESFSSFTVDVLTANNFTALDVDSQGRLWMATQSDYYQVGGVFMLDDTTWTAYEVNNSQIPDYFINDLKIDASDNVWIATNSNGLAKFDGQTWTTYRDWEWGVGDDRVQRLCFDQNDNVWLALEKYSSKGGVSKFDGNQFINYNSTDGTYPMDKANSVFISSAGRIFSGAEEYGLVERSGATWNKVDLSEVSLPYNGASVVFVDKDDTKWFGTERYGLAKFNWKGWTTYTTENSALPDNHINAINQDSFDNIWVGTDSGAVRISGTEMTVFNTANTPNIYSDYINDIAIKGDSIFLASGNGYSIYDGQNWHIHYPGNLPNFPSAFGSITTILVDKDDNVWMGQNGYGVIKYNGVNCQGFSTTNSGLTYAGVVDLAMDSAGNLWVATRGNGGDGNRGGLYKYDGDTWTNYRTNNSGLVCDWLETVTIDQQGNLWAGGMQYYTTTGGGFSILKDGVWESFTKDNSKLPYTFVKDIAFDSKGTAWIGMAYLGVIAYNPEGVTAIRASGSDPVKDFTLKQNYPNPFNPSTRIAYQLTRRAHVELTVHTALGQQVRTLVNGEQAAGNHSVIFDATGLSSGVYFYRLRNGSFTQSHKMILLR